jgi:hypothetical protein
MATSMITTPSVAPPPDVLTQEISIWGEQVTVIEISDQASYNAMAEMLTELATLRKRIIDHHAPIKKATDAAHKAAVQAEKKMLAPVQIAEALAKRKITVWDTEQQRILAEQQRQAREESERRGSELQLAAAVEMERLGGTEEEVAAVLESAPPLPTPRVQPTYAKASNVTTTTRWRAEVTSLKELCAAIGRADQPESLAMGIKKYEDTLGATWISSPTLNKLAQAMNTTMNIAGVKAVPETGVSVRTSE